MFNFIQILFSMSSTAACGSVPVASSLCQHQVGQLVRMSHKSQERALLVTLITSVHLCQSTRENNMIGKNYFDSWLQGILPVVVQLQELG